MPPLPDPAPVLRLVRVGYGHPDAVRLVEEVQQEYVVRYGSPDVTPLDPLMFEPPTGSFFVGYRDAPDGTSEAVATGAWRRVDLPVLGVSRTAELKRMYVSPRAQRAGHARTVLAALEADAAAYGAEAMVLETGVRQPEAIALYRSAGYVAVPDFGHYAGEALSRCYGRLLDPALAAAAPPDARTA
ncbi:GNAT family N-acetyltransferase [Nocardioides aquaticus]